MTDCTAMRDLLPAYLDHELSPDQRSALERHLEACPACQEEARLLRQDERLLRVTVGSPVAVQDRVTDRVWAAIRQEEERNTVPRTPWFAPVLRRLALSSGAPGVATRPFAWGFGGVAAVAVLLMVLFTRSHSLGPTDLQVASLAGPAFWHSSSTVAWQPLDIGTVLHAGDSLKTGEGRVSARWKDGSRMELGPNGEGRVLRLFPGLELKSGKVWAQIKQHPSADIPFTIRSPQATAQAMGTQFVVEAQPVRHATALLVIEGAVRFFNMKGSVTARDWSRTEATDTAGPTAPIPVSPLAPNSMWWIK
jgi:hypothetical protein